MKHSVLLRLITTLGILLTGCSPPETPPADYVSANVGTLKYVPGGTFQRDATATNTSTVTGFRIGVYEITRAQFDALMGTDPSDPTYSSGTDDPVQMTNWYCAIAFCNKLSLAENLTPVYSVSGVDFTTLTYGDIPTATDADWNAADADWDADGYRLPTEMEWLWAAMGARNGTTGYAKAFAGSTGSNAIGDYAVYGSGSGQPGATVTERSDPVGGKLPNELGLYDMTGNVWEWNWDLFAVYPTGPVTDYRGPAAGSSRAVRGADWQGDTSMCALSYRLISGDPFGQYYSAGIRVARR